MENWKRVDGYEWLEVSDHGRVRTLDSERAYTKKGKIEVQRKQGIVMRPFKGNNGYFHVAPKIGNKRNKLLVHRLVAFAFAAGHFEGAHVNHIDGNKENNHWTNLEWVTVADNTRKQWQTGLVNLRGENHPSGKLTEADVIEIRRLVATGTKKITIAKMFGVSTPLVIMIAQRRRWSHLP